MHDINAVDRFENLLSDTLADGPTPDVKNLIEQWTGPRHTIALHTFRVDSPMKGHVSEMDETRLSFHVATIDTGAGIMTVRECLWNVDPGRPDAPLTRGASTTIALGARR